MTIEAMIEENSREIRQLTLAVMNIAAVIQAIGGKSISTGDNSLYDPDGIDEAPPRALDVIPDKAPPGTLDATPIIKSEDFGELDDMDCPFDPSIMGINKTKNKTGALAGCWKKKKDATYTNSMYVADRRKLIEAVVASRLNSSSDETPPTITPPTIAPPGPPPTIAPPGPPPPISPTMDVEELPVIHNVETIDSDDFSDLCRSFTIKHGDAGANYLNQQLLACSQPPGTTPDTVDQQDMRAWISNQVINYDATHA